ncbi:hypothetical protein LTS18_012603 [Coniosporium uncinatum]|uniref:Uncharacterized protein n=1 Tax=Coniosporium uncinatum TaxID=93489 RepID=A0ACC3DVP5_9PEZI|nr:hypothetical protein LTS18_012603 [Coniosporium uncinatum]
MDLRCNIKLRSDSPPELGSPRATISSDNLPQDFSIADYVDHSTSTSTRGNSEPMSDVTRRRQPPKRGMDVSRDIDAFTARTSIPPTTLGPLVPMGHSMRIYAYGHGKDESGLDNGEVASGDDGAKATQLNLKSGDLLQSRFFRQQSEQRSQTTNIKLGLLTRASKRSAPPVFNTDLDASVRPAKKADTGSSVNDLMEFHSSQADKRKQKQDEAEFKGHPNDSFLRLARELRDMVYGYLVVDDKPIELTNCKPPTADISTNIFLVCREVTEECEEMFYRKNSFLLDHPDTATATADVAAYQNLMLKGTLRGFCIIKDLTVEIPCIPKEKTAQQLKEQGLLNHLKFCGCIFRALRPDMDRLRFVYPDGEWSWGYCRRHWPYYDTYGKFMDIVKGTLKVQDLELVLCSKYRRYNVQTDPKRAREELANATYAMPNDDSDTKRMGWAADSERDLSAYVAVRRAESEAKLKAMREADRRERQEKKELLDF